MRNIIDTVLKAITDFFSRMTRRERIRLVILVILVIALGIVVASILGRTTYSILYSGLSEEESGEIFSALVAMGEDAQLQGTGTILVPDDRVSELLITMASQGYTSKDFDYSLFNQASGFGMTDLEKQTLIQYQLEANIRTVLCRMGKIKDAMVILTLPKESLFVLSNTRAKASAAVMLEVVGGVKLTQSEVNAVADLVKDSVSGLDIENITITDTNMNQYRVGNEGDLAGDAMSQLAFKQDYQAIMEEQVLNVIAPIVGESAINVTVNAELSFNSVVSESIEFSPPIDGELTGMVVSAYSQWGATRTDGTTGGVVGTDENGMGTPEYPYGTLEDGELNEQLILETNYALNEKTTQIKENGWKVTGLSIAISLDSTKVTEDYTQAVRNLVAGAIGLSDQNYISVERLPFNDTSQSIADAFAAQEEFMNTMRIRDYIEKAVTWALITILVVIFLLLVRSIVRSARRPAEAASGGAVDYLASEDLLQEAGMGLEIDLNAKPENIMNLEKLIERDAGAVAQLLRNWITDD